MTDQTHRVLASYINALADLAQPKASIPLLHDQARLNAYQIALAGALHELPGDILDAVMSGLSYGTQSLVYIVAPIHPPNNPPPPFHTSVPLLDLPLPPSNSASIAAEVRSAL